MSDAETLRRAAKLMRERAEAATPGPWETYETFTHRCIGEVRSDPEVRRRHQVGFAVERTPANADHMASWHPAVALPVADWLVFEARTCERADANYPERAPQPADEHALAVARAYLQESP